MIINLTDDEAQLLRQALDQGMWNTNLVTMRGLLGIREKLETHGQPQPGKSQWTREEVEAFRANVPTAQASAQFMHQAAAANGRILDDGRPV